MQRAKRNEQLWLRVGKIRQLVFGRLLLLLQMPKTGSQTIEASLQACPFPHHIIRCHYLSAMRQAEISRSLLGPAVSETWKESARQQMDQMRWLRAVIRWRQWLRRFSAKVPKLELITAVREPIGLVLSSVFQNYLYFVSRPELLTPELCREVLQRPQMFTSLENWFDLELKAITGIDVYQAAFPRERGYAIYENANARVLVYRFEALHQLPSMLREFLGCKVGAIISKNVARSKPYAEPYKHAKTKLVLPLEFARARYASRMAQHFYSGPERAVFLEQWTTKRVNANRLRDASPGTKRLPPKLTQQAQAEQHGAHDQPSDVIAHMAAVQLPQDVEGMAKY